MKTKIALLLAAILGFFSIAEGAFVVTSINSGDVPSISDPDVVGRMYGRIGFPSSQDEAFLYGTSTVSTPVSWQTGMAGVYEKTSTFLTLSIGSSAFGLSGDVSLGPVSYSDTFNITSIYIWVESEGTSSINSIQMNEMVIERGGLGSYYMDSLMANGGTGDGTTFDGYRIDVSGGSGVISLGWKQDFEKQPGAFLHATGDQQNFSVMLVGEVIPEPSSALLGLIGSMLLLRRKRS